MTKATNSSLFTRMHFLSHYLKLIFMACLNNQEAKMCCAAWMQDTSQTTKTIL